MRRSGISIVGALLLSACSFSFDRQSEVKYRRILAIQADPPEIVVVPGTDFPTTVKFSALVVDPGDTGVSVSYEWRNCVESLGKQGLWDNVQNRCLENDSTRVVQVEMTTPASGAAPLADYATHPIEVSLDNLIPAVAGDQDMGVTSAKILLPFFFTEAGKSIPASSFWADAMIRVDNGSKPALYGIKRVVISPNVPAGRTPNRIPHLTGLLFDYKPWSSATPMEVQLGSCADDKKVEIPNRDAKLGEPATFTVCRHTITPVFDPSQSESYTVQTFDKDASGNWIMLPLKERLRFQWQVDQGSTDNNETEEPDTFGTYDYDPISVHWDEPHAPTTSGGNLWLVIKDGRGGESWEIRKLTFKQ